MSTPPCPPEAFCVSLVTASLSGSTACVLSWSHLYHMQSLWKFLSPSKAVPASLLVVPPLCAWWNPLGTSLGTQSWSVALPGRTHQTSSVQRAQNNCTPAWLLGTRTWRFADKPIMTF